jgi:tetratricopeptide (TPR) repeat protein
MQKMPITQHAVAQLNLAAIGYMRHANYQKAEALLEKALRDLDKCEKLGQVSGKAGLSWQPAIELGTVMLNPLLSSQDDMGAFEMYGTAFTIFLTTSINVEGTGGSTYPAAKFNNIMFAVLYYNLGLCLHLSGLSSGNECYLRRSLMAYETALGPLDRIEDQASGIWLELAILNNCAYIYGHFFEIEEAEFYIERMQNWLLDPFSRTVADSGLLQSFSSNAWMKGHQFSRQALAASD